MVTGKPVAGTWSGAPSRMDLESIAEGTGSEDEAQKSGLPRSELPRRSFATSARQAIRWARREILLALVAAFIVGLGAGAAEALISWLTS